MKRLRRISGFLALAMALAALASCANPALDSVAPTSGSAASAAASPAAGASAHSLTLAWNAGSSRSILPASYPLPVSYDIILHPAVGNDVTRSVSAKSTCTFDGLEAVVYAITVNGKDSGGNIIVSGTGSADMRGTAPVYATIMLYYTSTGAGAGTIDLTFNAPSGTDVDSATLTLVSPSGSVTSGVALTPTSPTTFRYANASAAAGSWKMLLTFVAGDQSAMKLETVLVLDHVTTTATVPLAAADFSPSYVAVTGLALDAPAMTLVMGGASGSLAATLSPATASNALVTWASSAAGVAGVDQNGTVTSLSAGTATITATSVDHPAATATCAVTVLASYGVTYEANNATTGTAPAAQTKVQGTGLSLSANSGSLVRTGHAFAGWNTASDGSGTSYAAGASYVTDAALALFAKWTINTCNITYGANGSTGGTAPSTQTKTYGTNLSLAAKPGALVRTGYSFAGWNTAADGTGTDYAAGATYTTDTALGLFAKWTTISYSIGYTLNDGTNNGGNPATYTVATTTITLADPSRAGHTFVGWSPASSISSGSTGDKAFTANWIVNSYTVTFDGQGGTTPSLTNKSVTYDSTYGTLATTTYTGYTFGGWWTGTGGTGTQITSGTGVTMTGNQTLYANWIPPTANLSALALSGSPMGYAFLAGTYSYGGITVSNLTTSVTVAPTGAGAITVNGTAVASGSASGSIALTAGSATTITVVAAETGKTARTYTLSVTQLLAVGNNYGGGVLAYIYVSSDLGWVSGEQHGLIAASTNQCANIVWALTDHVNTLVPNGTSTLIGKGSVNTDHIIAQNGAGTGYAAGLARACRDGNYSDWFLPSRDELNKLYLNKGSIGNFGTAEYWSSSEDGGSFALVQSFIAGAQGHYQRNLNRCAVRAVRSF